MAVATDALQPALLVTVATPPLKKGATIQDAFGTWQDLVENIEYVDSDNPLVIGIGLGFVRQRLVKLCVYKCLAKNAIAYTGHGFAEHDPNLPQTTVKSVHKYRAAVTLIPGLSLDDVRLPLPDSMASEHGVRLNRASDFYQNGTVQPHQIGRAHV